MTAMSPSTMTSIAYNMRARLGFQILMCLLSNGFIDEAKIPSDVAKMIRVWTNMKKGRKHNYQEKISGRLVSLLDDVPGSGSEEICSDYVASRIQSEGEQLIIDGYVVIYPIGLENKWSYKRTIAGDQLLRVTGYSSGA